MFQNAYTGRFVINVVLELAATVLVYDTAYLACIAGGRGWVILFIVSLFAVQAQC